jgi:hypothetical protein
VYRGFLRFPVDPYSLDILLMHFQRLASAFIEQKQPGTGRPILSVPARAYGAFRHGFAAGFPLHSPKGAILHDDVGRFPSEEAFLAYQQRVHLMAEILYLGDLETDGSRRVERVSPIVYSSQLKPLVQITYLAAKWQSGRMNPRSMPTRCSGQWTCASRIWSAPSMCSGRKGARFCRPD